MDRGLGKEMVVRCRKGNAFTVEALLGSMLFMIFIWSLSSYGAFSGNDSWSIAQEKLADDALIVLEKDGTLATQNSTLISEGLVRMLGNNTSFRMEMKTYNYTNSGFVSIVNSSFGSSIPDDKGLSVAERSFISSYNGSASNYSVARLYLWR